MYFKDIIGQEEVKERLRQSTRTGIVPHAQLFTEQGGGRGVSAGFGLRPLSELYEPDGDGRLRTLPVMP